MANTFILKKLFPLFILITTLLFSCNWFNDPPKIGLVLADHFDDKLYKKFDTAAYNLVFRKRLDSLDKEFSNPKTLKAYYGSVSFEPVLITRFFANGNLAMLAEYIGKSGEHGFNPEQFRHQQIKELLIRLSGNQFKRIEEVYPVIADLELRAAEGLIRYNNQVYYGCLNPKWLLNRYFIPVKRPDSLSITGVLSTRDLSGLLKKIQPVSVDYKLFQQWLKDHAGLSKERMQLKTVLVNMERLRWKLPDLGDEFVQVNIPDFSLTWFKAGDTLSHMKVCVGGRREQDFEEKIKLYLKTKNLDDKPKNHQTPILYSKFNAIQVNPIWNIPVSIAQSEIYWQALKDPYYLSNNNIKVYLKGKLVADPDTIQWNRYPREKLPFQFKQGSGEQNALGKFKFIFDNGSSVYLHDTNNKYAFNLSNRAISHGCVRVERPLEFAELLVKDAYQFDDLRMEVNLPPLDTTRMEVFNRKLAKKADTLVAFQLKPKWFGVKKQVPILINYITAWASNGKIEFRSDVYDLDETLWIAMRKFL